MKWDIENICFVGIVIAFLAVLVVMYFQSGRINDCAKRGGYAVETSAGWVCAKLEKV
jgi:hypothetical protein